MGGEEVGLLVEKSGKPIFSGSGGCLDHPGVWGVGMLVVGEP